MIDLVKQKYAELEARKRAELEASLEEGQVAEPISLTAILTSIAISAAVSTASYLVSRAFAPKPPKQQFGKLSGSLQLQNSEQGIFIPEIYGAGPAATIVTGSAPTYQNLTNVTAGGGGALTKTSGANNTYNAGASHNVAVASGDAFIEVTPGIGWAIAGFFDTASPTGSGGTATDCICGVQWGPDGSVWGIVNEVGVTIATWVTGDVFRVELKNGRFNLYKNSALLSGFANALAIPTYPLYMGVICYTTGAGVSAAEVQIGSIGDSPNEGRGGIKVPAIIIWSSGIRKNVTTTPAPTRGGKGGGGGGEGAGTVENITYDIDLGMMFSRGPVNLIREYANADILIDQYIQTPNPSGVYDSTVGADDDYDPESPPNPQDNYLPAFQRVDADIPFDGDGVGTGTIQGGASQFAIYPGNEDQQPDPTIEADTDAKYGVGSTPAYKGHSYIVHKNFSLSRWSGIVPNITAVWEHQTLKTLDDIYASFCERVNVLAANSDYDFTGLSAITSRGMLIAGRPFAPAEVMDSPEIKLSYNYFVTEADGQVIGLAEGDEPELEIDDTEVGWLDGDAELPEIAPEIETAIAPEISLPKEVHVKSLDPDNDWEPNTQSAIRQITDGESVELLEVQIAQLADERRATAQRALYQTHISASVHKFTLPWTYLYLYPGYRIVINRAEGFVHTLRLTSISGGVGVLDCEAVQLEPSVFTQPANGVLPPGYIPPQPIPAMTIVQLLDTPLLRDGDETNNNGVGFYMAGVPRTGINQSWLGFVLYIQRSGDWQIIANSTLPATVGTVVSVVNLNTTDTSVIDRTGVVTVDLYGTTATLTSVTEAELLAIANLNLAIIGSMVFQFATATQVAGFPNRWELSTLLNGRRGTEWAVTETFTGKRFTLINEAVKFVPMEIADIGMNTNYRAVSAGQSLGDAATVEFAWLGETLRPLSPVNLRGTRNPEGDLYIQWTRRSRFGGGMIPRTDVPLGEQEEAYIVECLTTGDVLKRTMRVVTGTAQAALIMPNHNADISANNLSVGSTPGLISANAHTEFSLNESGSWVEGTLYVPDTDSSAHIGILEKGVAPFYGVGFAPTPSYAGAIVTFHKFELSTKGLTVNDNAAGLPQPKYNNQDVVTLDTIRIRILVLGSEVRYYWDYIGPGSTPFYVSRVPPVLPLRGVFAAVNNGEVRNIFMGTSREPSVVYAAGQQTADGFTPNVSQIKVRVAQVSALVGRGPYVEGTF